VYILKVDLKVLRISWRKNISQLPRWMCLHLMFMPSLTALSMRDWGIGGSFYIILDILLLI